MNCVICGKVFKQYRSTQKVCGYRCAIKTTKKRNRELKESLKSHREWLKDLQAIFNKFIRLRDQEMNCISCGVSLKDRKFDAGHYRSVGGNPQLRFNEQNVHGQCVKCNRDLHGNLIEYRKRLIQRIGIEKVEYLENYNQPNKLTIPEIKSLIKEYKVKIKAVK